MKILIISSSNDSSTEYVMDWIKYYGHEAIRYNAESDFNNLKASISHLFGNNYSSGQLTINNIVHQIDSINSIWIRKFFKPNNDLELSKELNQYYQTDEIFGHLRKEFFSGMFAFFKLWNRRQNILGARITNQPSKMEMLIAAEKFKIKIPSTLITERKVELKKFLSIHKRVITKPLKDVNLLVKNKNDIKNYGFMYTELLTEESLVKISDTFYISQFQECIGKEFEIRAFYLDGKIYASAIFSQLDTQTNVDFRMYNNEKNNRTIPYKLPKTLILKIRKLMSYLNLKTGSIDLIKTKSEEYYFLEINPWGQYDMIAKSCNYNLNKLIAKYLIENGK